VWAGPRAAEGTETSWKKLGRGAGKPKDGSSTFRIGFNSNLKTGTKTGVGQNSALLKPEVLIQVNLVNTLGS